MSYTVYELRDSESGSVETEGESGEVWNVTKKYVIGQCPGGMGEVKDAISDYLPRYWASSAGYWRRRSMGIKGLGKQCFEVTGEYTTLLPTVDSAASGSGDGDDSNYQAVPGSIAWDTTGVTEHITSAREERVIGGEANDFFEGAINVQGTNVAGMDRVVPAMRYSETWILPAQVAVSDDYVKAVYSLTGTVNKSRFRAFEPGEALFLGGRAQWSGDQPYATVSFEWQARANDPAFYVKGLPTTPKLGWEYPWVVYQPFVSGANVLVQKPRCLVIDTIYEQKDWSSLGIANSPGRRRTGSQADPATAAAVAAFFN